MSETMEGKPGESEPELTLAEEVVNAVEQLGHFEIKTQREQRLLRAEFAMARNRVTVEGIPEGLELEAGVLLTAGRHKFVEQGRNSSRLLMRLKDIDESLGEHRGQVVIWLSREDEIISDRETGITPSQKVHLLNIGILPAETKIRVNSIGEFFIPMDRYMSIKLVNNRLGREMDFDEGNLVTSPGVLEYQITESVEAYLSPKRLLSGKNFIAVGNDEVYGVIDDNGLEDDAYVVNAAATLLDSFREAHNLEPELPPAA